MARVALSVPEILVNDTKIAIVPNTFTYDKGENEANVRAASDGNGITSSVHTVDAESGISEVMFSMYVTDITDDLIRQWKDLIGANNIKAIQAIPGGIDITLGFPGQSLTNKPTREGQADGVVALEFKGDQGI
jgi:hypothetical protein